MESVNEKMSISLYLQEDYTDVSVEVADLMQDIQEISPDISVQYKDKGLILEEMRKQEPKLVQILEKNNPLPNTIVLGKIGIDDYERVNAAIENKLFVLANSNDVDNFANYTTQYKRIQDVIVVLEVLKTWLIVIIVIFFAAIAVISYSVISNFIYYYKDEIYITKLVGGAKSFIYGPFVLQGIIYAVISFLLNVFILRGGLQYIQIVFASYNFDSIYISNTILWAELLLFVCIGAISGYFSSVSHLKKWINK